MFLCARMITQKLHQCGLAGSELPSNVENSALRFCRYPVVPFRSCLPFHPSFPLTVTDVVRFGFEDPLEGSAILLLSIINLSEALFQPVAPFPHLIVLEQSQYARVVEMEEVSFLNLGCLLDLPPDQVTQPIHLRASAKMSIQFANTLLNCLESGISLFESRDYLIDIKTSRQPLEPMGS